VRRMDGEERVGIVSILSPRERKGPARVSAWEGEGDRTIILILPPLRGSILLPPGEG
jgi:hypothetical protein